MVQNRKKGVIWHLTNLLAIIAGYQSTSVYSGMGKTPPLKFSVFGKDQALLNFLFSAAGVYPGRLLVQAH